MVINNFKRLRGKIAAVLVIVFCLSLVSIPEVLINAQETKQEAQMRVEILSPRVNEDGTCLLYTSDAAVLSMRGIPFI